jgi:sugar/nucleoside kinase (ribokinase family)
MAREFEAQMVIVTLGETGSLAWCNGRIIRTPGFQVACVDTTGAGDVFRGAFMAACLGEPSGDVENALEYANAAAALSCRALGARGAIPGPIEVERLLDARTHM